MIQAGCGLSFVQEPPSPVGIAGNLGRQSFHRDDTVEPGIARLIDLAHSPAPSRARISVRAEPKPRGKGHMTSTDFNPAGLGDTSVVAWFTRDGQPPETPTAGS